MTDQDNQASVFGKLSFIEIGYDNMRPHCSVDFDTCKLEKVISATNEGRHITSPWNDETLKCDKDTRYPRQELSRDGAYDKSIKNSEMYHDRDLPPFEPSFDKKCWESSSKTIEVSMSHQHCNKRHASEQQLQENAPLKIKKQCVSLPVPDNDKDLQAEALNGYSSLSILQSWSSGTLISDKHNTTLSEQSSASQADHPDGQDLEVSEEFVSRQCLPYSETVPSQDVKTKHHYRCMPHKGGSNNHRSFNHGSNVQHLLHEDRVKDFIGDRQGRSAWSSGGHSRWDDHQPPWRFPYSYESGYQAMPMNYHHWDRHHRHQQQNPKYGSVDQRDIHTQFFHNPYQPPAFAVSIPKESIIILALPEDRTSLSEILCLVRENIEVFAATDDEIKAPAPGRKRPVFEGQVGLRCVHCRWSVNQYDRVKRAVCYPSSLQRIYRTIIDMKLDHFKACKCVPFQLKMKLDDLMCNDSRSTGTTMQYIVWAAKKLGLVDSEHGIRFSSSSVELKKSSKKCTLPMTNPNSFLKQKEIPSSTQEVYKTNDKCLSLSGSISCSKTSVSKARCDNEYNGPLEKPCLIQDASFSLSIDFSFEDGAENIAVLKESKSVDLCTPINNVFHGKIVLALPDDRKALTPLRCFLRQNVCAFSATSEDVVDRSATAIVTEGQVGIACLHCMRLPSKERSNRSMCFPFTMSRIYQAVADIQRFHFNECKMVPPEIKQKFCEYQSSSAKGSKGLATRQYWVTSAEKLGLIDSPHGIRFSRDPSLPRTQDFRIEKEIDDSDISPLVLPEDKGTIADFLYLTMLQVKPCRFKEADRNKRRLKDVGCKGVECRHCVGLVDGRKFFWSSVNAVESNFVSVHTHMIECKMVPQPLKDELIRLKALRKEQTSRLKNGSQKAFFLRVWQRLHPEGSYDIPSSPSSPVRLNSHINDGRFTFMPRVTPSQATVFDSASHYHSASPTNQCILSNYQLNDPRNRFRLQSDVYDLSVPRIDSIEAYDDTYS